VKGGGHILFDAQKFGECHPELACELGVPIRDEGSRHTMKSEDLIKEESSNISCRVGSMTGAKVDLL
jgi:hypothetical protein